MPNLVDILIVVIVAYEAFAGLDRGFLRQTATLVGMLLGVGAALLGYPGAARLLYPLVPNASWANAIAFVLVALAVWLGFIALSRQADQGLDQAGWDWINRLVGLLIGMLVGLILSVGVLLILARIPSLVPRETIEQSTLTALILRVMPGLSQLLPVGFPLIR
jgi:membrane protein required for colicin V production